jgi:hypothetical protein
MGWITWVQFRVEAGIFSLLQSAQTGSGAHPITYPVGTGACYPGVLGGAQRTPFQLMPTLRMRGAIPPLSHTSSGHSG